jgi:hypothetical protein
MGSQQVRQPLGCRIVNVGRLGSLFLNQFIASSMAFFFCAGVNCPSALVFREVRQSRKSGLVDVLRLHLVVAGQFTESSTLGPSPRDRFHRAGSPQGSPPGCRIVHVGRLGSLFLNQFIASSMAFFFCVGSQFALRHWCSREVRQSVRVGSLTSWRLELTEPVH